jgi:threonyl-tRNA synthetase
VGDKEMATDSVAVRARGNQDLGVMSVNEFAVRVVDETSKRK